MCNPFLIAWHTGCNCNWLHNEALIDMYCDCAIENEWCTVYYGLLLFYPFSVSMQTTPPYRYLWCIETVCLDSEAVGSENLMPMDVYERTKQTLPSSSWEV